MEKTVCRHCGHKWFARVLCPVQCPKCKRYDYEKIKVPAKLIKRAKGIVK